MSGKIKSNESESPLDQIRTVLTEKNARITALEAALPTLGGGLLAEAVVFYLVAQNAEYLTMCNALATFASSALETPDTSATQAGDETAFEPAHAESVSTEADENAEAVVL